MTNEKLNLTQTWDKTFAKSPKVEHVKKTFHNRYGITLAADMYFPKTTKGKGVSFMENKAEWHGKAPNEEQYKQAIQELKK